MIIFHLSGSLPKTALPSKRLDDIGLLTGKSLAFRVPRYVTLAYVGSTKMQRLNAEYRGVNRPTDVLSFEPAKDFPVVMSSTTKKQPCYFGDIIICPQYAAQEAKRRGIPFEEELARLLIHGLLHLAGFDHATPADEAKMFKRQERLVEAVMSAV